MNITDSDLISTVAAAIRYAYAVAVQPKSFPPDLDLVGTVEEWRGEAEAAINAVFDYDATDTVAVYWYDCECVYLTKFCDENHSRSALVPRSVLRAMKEPNQ